VIRDPQPDDTMSEEDTKRSSLTLILWTVLTLSAVCWYRERVRRTRAESACRAAVGLSAALATSRQQADDERLREVAALARAGREGDLEECTRRADALAAELLTDAPLFADASAKKAAKGFFRERKALGERFAGIARQGRSAEKEGRDAMPVRRVLQTAFGAAARSDEEGVGKALSDAEKMVEHLPRRSRPGRGTRQGLDASPTDTARRILMECEHPKRVAAALMTEGCEAAVKVHMAATFLLAEGEAEPALWLAETAAFLLGLRFPAEANTSENPTPTERAAELPEATPVAVEGWLSTGEALLQGREAAGMAVSPADALLEEGERFLDAGKTAVAGVLARAALNLLGMSDHAIRKMTEIGSDSSGKADTPSPEPGVK